MKIIEAITEADSLKANAFTVTAKIKWLSRLDMRVKNEIIDTHELNEGETAPASLDYGPDDAETVLLVPEPYAEMYIHWLEAQIDYYNMEYEGFNAANSMFDSVYESYRNYYNRDHAPKGTKKTYF